MLRLPGLTPGRFRIGVAVLLAAVFLALQIAPSSETALDRGTLPDDDRLHVFTHPDCPHCHRAFAFLHSPRSTSSPRMNAMAASRVSMPVRDRSEAE